MGQSIYEDIFLAIKHDDVVSFSVLVKGNENLSFGRFPLLSIIYLYDSKKIEKEYFDVLCKISDFRFIPEYIEIYKIFRAKGKKVIRLYRDSNVISPIEMLCVLHRDGYVSKKFNQFSKTEKAIDNIKKIFALNKQKVVVTSTTISISRAPLSHRQIYISKLSIAIACVFVVVALGVYITTGVTVGLSLEISPLKISTQSQLVDALNSRGHYILQEDIILENFEEISQFDGLLDGGGNTIFLTSLPSKYLIKINNGSIKNLNIVYEDIVDTISYSQSLFVYTNTGNLSGINITCDSFKLSCNKSDAVDIHISGVAINNSGNVKNCTIKIGGELESVVGNGECTFSGVVGSNNGDIQSCVFESGKILTRNVDICGIAESNEASGRIINCVSKGALAQESAIEGWSPSIGGISIANYGYIYNCKNLGDISIGSTANTSEGIAFASGICAMNYGSINKCLNKGNIEVISTHIEIYSGGISAYSSYWIEGENVYISKIENCGSECEINLSLDDEEKGICAGGISGYFHGILNNCFSLSTFSTGYDETRYFIGSCLGAVYGRFVQFFPSIVVAPDIEAGNNVVLDCVNLQYQIGCMIINNSRVATGFDLTSEKISTYVLVEDIEKSEVYWNE